MISLSEQNSQDSKKDFVLKVIDIRKKNLHTERVIANFQMNKTRASNQRDSTKIHD